MIEQLTPRECECLRLVARGYSTKQIARGLNLSEPRVANLIHSANRKLRVSSRMDAARILAEHENREVFVIPGMANTLPPTPQDPAQPLSDEEAGQGLSLREERIAFDASDPTYDLGTPLRGRGGRRNDLTSWQRALWIVLLAAMALLGAGALVSGLGSLSDQIILVPTPQQ